MPRERWILAGLFLAALAVRLYYANSLFLNPDECLHVNAGSSAQWAVYHHPPLLLWWLWAATLISDQEWWLRLVPTVAGALMPLAAGFWLRRWMSPVTAWGLAALLAFTPNLVLLSIQLRGYPMALLGIAVALYALDRALAESSRRWLVLHFAALTFAILAEFMTAWVALAMGLYGLSRLVREPEQRRLVPIWLAGQCGGLGLYIVLYVAIVRPVIAAHNNPALIETYLRGAFPQEGENLLRFFAVASMKQLVYIAGSLPGGAVAILFLLIGLFYFLRNRNSLAVLICGLAFTAAGAIAKFYPYGRSRHTVALGLIALLAIGAGIERLSHSWRSLRWAAPAGILALAFLFPMPDLHNLTIEGWSKAKWYRALAEVQRLAPPGSTILADDEALQMLQARLAPRSNRSLIAGPPKTLSAQGITLRAHLWDWGSIPRDWILEQSPPAGGTVWLLDTGFNVGLGKPVWRELGAEIVVEEPGILILARLQRNSSSSKLVE